MEYRVPSNVQELLRSYIDLLATEFDKRLYGVYIYGSLALDSYNEVNSNIDFITVLAENPSEQDIEKIQSVHNKLGKMNPLSYKLEGEYTGLQDILLGKYKVRYPYFAYNQYQGKIEIRSFTWFQLKECGVTIYGEGFDKLGVEINWENVRKELYHSLNEYWPKKTNKNLKLLSDDWVSLIVLTLCRIHYTLENKSVISKAEAGRIALTKLNEEWHPLIYEAIRIQTRSSKVSLFGSRMKRLSRVKEFVPYMTALCNPHSNIDL